jgi:exosortase
VLLAHVPLLVVHGRQIWLRPHYQFFPLVLLGAAVLAITRLYGFGSLRPAPLHWSLPLVGMAWALLAVAELLYSSWLGAVAALVLLGAALFAAGGGRLFRAALPAWLLLWLVIPPPFELDRQLILSLQTFTAGWSSRILDFLGVYHVMAGNVVEVGGRRLLVAEACSGVNSLFSVLACTLFFVFWARRPVVQSLLLLTAAVAWVLLANVARVTLVAYTCARSGVDLTVGWRHEALGMLLFAVALGLLWSTDRLLQFLLAPSKEKTPVSTLHESIPAAENAGRRASFAFGLAVWGAGAAYAILLVAHVALYGTGLTDNSVSGPTAAALPDLDADTLPAQVASWERQGFTTETRDPGSAFGEVSRIWQYRLGQKLGLLSLDSPFPSWHDLTRCYTGQGWQIDEETVHAAEGAKGDRQVGHVEVQLSKPGYRSGYLLFCQLNQQGVVLEPRQGGSYLSVYRHRSTLRSWWQGLHGAPASTATDPPGPVYQLQLFVESYEPLTGEDQVRARMLFLKGFESLRPPSAGVEETDHRRDEN